MLIIADFEDFTRVIVGPGENKQRVRDISLIGDGQPQFDVALAALEVLVIDIDSPPEAYLIDLLFRVRVQRIKAQYRVLLPQPVHVHVQLTGQDFTSNELDAWRRDWNPQPKYPQDVVYCVEAGDGLDAEELSDLYELVGREIAECGISFEDLLIL